MNYEEMLLPILNKAINVIETSGDFVIEQSPLILQEFMLWKTFELSVWTITGLLLIFVAPKILSYTGSTDSDYDYDVKIFGRYFDSDYPAFYLMVIGGIFCILCGITMFAGSAMQLAKIIIAPKVYLLEYAASLIK